jgi:3-Oxoacyl-[acyl-carrier-protein (ACP)] synthase III C terminal
LEWSEPSLATVPTRLSLAALPIVAHGLGAVHAGAMDAERDGRLRPGARVLVSAFGAGFTWGGGVLRWGGSGDV